MKNTTKYATGLLIALSFTSCQKDILVEKPLDIITPDNLYIDKPGFESGIYGLLTQVRQERADTDGGNNTLTFTPAFVGVDNAAGTVCRHGWLRAGIY